MTDSEKEFVKTSDKIFVGDDHGADIIINGIRTRFGAEPTLEIIEYVRHGAMLISQVVQIGYQNKETVEAIFGVSGRMVVNIIKAREKVKMYNGGNEKFIAPPEQSTDKQNPTNSVGTLQADNPKTV